VNIENLVMINFFGEGYYSGNTESQTMIVDKNFYEQYQDEINNYQPTFHELDGKHSTVIGTLSVNVVTKENLSHVVSRVLEDDFYPVSECLMWELSAPQEILEKQDKVHETFESLCKVETTVKYYYNGEEI